MKSRMTGDCHVRFCERLGVKSPAYSTQPDSPIVTVMCCVASLLAHYILPKGFRKIRYFGFLGNRDREASITTVRDLIEKSGCAVPLSATELSIPVYEHLCPTCGIPMTRVLLVDESSSDWLKNRLKRIRNIAMVKGFRSTA